MPKPCVIFDIDGTLSDVRHRLHYVTNGEKKWSEFYEACVDDPPHQHVVMLYQLIYGSAQHGVGPYAGLDIFICSGRPEPYRQYTVEWLKQQGITPLMYNELLMRRDKDYRPDVIIKKEMLHHIKRRNFWPMFAVDDRPTVIEMWYENGIPCFEVNIDRWVGVPKESQGNLALETASLGG